MLSINIPVYNIEVYDLVLQLGQQAGSLKVPFEIRVYDDVSVEPVKKANREIKNIQHVVYNELNTNLGRAAIRNKMGLESEYKYLLFIDADSKLISENYLADFLKNAKQNCIVCGGTAYQNQKPADAEKLLRWVYGTKREAVSAEIRNNKKGFIITSNNFLIEKKVFEKIHFREDIKKYGHEDTLLGFDLYKNGVEIKHIENAVEHTGLENSKEFLNKTKTALDSLYFISTELLKGNQEFSAQVYFLNRYSKITAYFPAIFLAVFYKMFYSFFKQNLLGKNPKLLFFDLYKLFYYATIK